MEKKKSSKKKIITNKTKEKELDNEENPKNSQSLPSSKYQFSVNDNMKNVSREIKKNEIKLSKYNIITFLPKSLLYQFFRLANVYFLIIAILQSIPIISPLNPLTAIIPIVFVLSVSIIREGIEDLDRHKFDALQNEEQVNVIKNGVCVKGTSGELLVGELVIVKKGGAFPADIVLLDSSLPDGLCFIETATLDGEKTLKNKTANKSTIGHFTIKNGDIFTAEIPSIEGEVVCNTPNQLLYEFDGIFEMTISTKKKKNIKEKVSLDAKQLLLKGAILKDTDWIIGFVVYTGHNTKLILNTNSSRLKLSSVENLLSNLLITILIAQLILSIVCAIGHSIYNSTYVAEVDITKSTKGYLPGYVSDSNSIDSVISYFSYILLLNTMIPISLVVSLEIIKVFQGYFISVDTDLFSFVRLR